MSDKQIADCNSNMHGHCYHHKREFDFCVNAIKYRKCPRGYIEDFVRIIEIKEGVTP